MLMDTASLILVPVSSLDMDIYTISRMLLQYSTKQVIVFAGSAHILHYASFFIDYLNGTLLFEREKINDYRCVTIKRDTLPIDPYEFRQHIINKRQPKPLTQQDREERRRQVLARYANMANNTTNNDFVIENKSSNIPRNNISKSNVQQMQRNLGAPVRFKASDLPSGYRTFQSQMMPRPKPADSMIDRNSWFMRTKIPNNRKQQKLQKLEDEILEDEERARQPGEELNRLKMEEQQQKLEQQFQQQQQQFQQQEQQMQRQQEQQMQRQQEQQMQRQQEQQMQRQQEQQNQIPTITPDMSEEEKRNIRRQRAALIAAKYKR
jgi:hypothetical protein